MTAQDRALLADAQAGDPRALEKLLAAHQGDVYRFGLRLCRNPEEAKDVLQETLLTAARGVRTFRGASSLSTWLYTIARSFCMKMHRRGKFAPAQEESLEREGGTDAVRVADTALPPDEALAAKLVGQRLSEAIAALDPPQREVLLLRDVEGLEASEVARRLQTSVAAVKSRLHRARQSLRERLAGTI